MYMHIPLGVKMVFYACTCSSKDTAHLQSEVN